MPEWGDDSMQADALEVIAERDARGEVADIYADIRATMGLPVVNLVWRHFATLDGGLRHAWDALRPVYASGAAEQAGARLVAALELPRLPAVPPVVLAGVGVDAAAHPLVLAVLDSYNRGNALNLCALSALLAAPPTAPDAAPGQPAAALPAPAVPIPPMPELEDMAPAVRALVWQVNTLGRPAGDRILASAWKHLALWPGALSLCWALLAPLQHDGRLAAAIAHTRTESLAEAARLAAICGGDPAAPGAAAVRRVAAEFVQRVIVRMVPAALMLRRALPDAPGGPPAAGG
jgi:hypothetical protein